MFTVLLTDQSLICVASVTWITIGDSRTSHRVAVIKNSLEYHTTALFTIEDNKNDIVIFIGASLNYFLFFISHFLSRGNTLSVNLIYCIFDQPHNAIIIYTSSIILQLIFQNKRF